MKDEEWARCARELQLVAYETEGLATVGSEVGFSERLRARRRVAKGVGIGNLLVGVRHGRRVALEHRGLPRHYEITCAVEIAPSLDLRAYVGPPGSRGLAHPRVARTGHPRIDGSLACEADSPEGLASLLFPRSPQDEALIDALIQLRVVVTDSVVWTRFVAEKLVDARDTLGRMLGDAEGRGLLPMEVAAEIDKVGALASELAARSDRVPPNAEEHARRDAWAAVGADLGLPFDSRSRALVGAREGAALRVALESWVAPLAITESKPPVSTTFVASFDPPLGLGLWVVPAGAFNWLSELVGGDLTVGAAAFDRAFAVRSDRDDAARALLARAAGPLSELARAGAHVELSDFSLTASRPGACASPAELRPLIEHGLAAVAALTGAHSAGPYRQAR